MNSATTNSVRLAIAGVAAFCTLFVVTRARADTVFHVASTGNDSNAGTEQSPFGSIERAQRAVREKIAAGLSDNVLVLIHGGTYELDQPLVFTSQDSGTAKYPITYAADSNETVVVSGGRRITGWKQEDSGLWSVVIPEVVEGKWYFHNLYINDSRATRACTPNRTDQPQWDSLIAADTNTWAMQLGAGKVHAWKNLSDVEIVLRGNWTIIRKRIRSADPATGTVIPEPPYILSSGEGSGFGPCAGCPFYLENAREFLDQPGEWYLDRSTGVLSYWPRPGEVLATAAVIAPRLNTLLEMRGTARQPIENLHVDGLDLEHTDCALPAEGYSGSSHGFYRVSDKHNGRLASAVSAEFTRACSIENCRLVHFGGSAVSIGNGCSGFVLEGNRLNDVGAIGVFLGFHRTPGQPGPNASQIPRSNQVANNEISACGMTYHDAAAVVVTFANDTLIAHNLIHDCPHHGISIPTTTGDLPSGFAGGTYIKNNDIHHVCQVMADSGPIYFWGKQPASCLISGNVVHDTKGYAALYFDDQTLGCRVEQNVVYNVTGRTIQFAPYIAESFVVRDNFWQGTNDFVRGKVGYALSFGDGRFLDFPHQAALEPLRLTVAAWVNLTAIPTVTNPCAWVVCKNTNELRNANYSLLISNNNVGAYLNIGGHRENCFAAWSSTGPLTPGTWHLLAMTYNGTNLDVFCDGQPVGSTVVGRARSPGKGPLRLGKRGDGYSASFPGLINEVRIYKRALSDAELNAQYNSPATPDSRLGPDLVFYWNANDTYSKLERIMANAGPEEPYRRRFAVSREASAATR